MVDVSEFTKAVHDLVDQRIDAKRSFIVSVDGEIAGIFPAHHAEFTTERLEEILLSASSVSLTPDWLPQQDARLLAVIACLPRASGTTEAELFDNAIAMADRLVKRCSVTESQ